MHSPFAQPSRWEGLVKSFGAVRALVGVDLRPTPAPFSACSAPTAPARPRPSASSPHCSTPTAARARCGLDVVQRGPRVRADRPHRPVRRGRRHPHRGREPADDRPALPAAGRRAQRADDLLSAFDLVDAAGRAASRPTPAACVAGSTSRPAWSARPPVLFLDEPTTGLDPRSRLAMWDVIEELVADGTTVLLTTQYLDEADRLADTIAVIDHGKRGRERQSGRAQVAGRWRAPRGPSDRQHRAARGGVGARAMCRSPPQIDRGRPSAGRVQRQRDHGGDPPAYSTRRSWRSTTWRSAATLDNVFSSLTGHGRARNPTQRPAWRSAVMTRWHPTRW